MGPNASAKTIGFMGRFNDLFCANESNTLTIMAVTGVESTTEEDNAENCNCTRNISMLLNTTLEHVSLTLLSIVPFLCVCQAYFVL